MPSLTIWLESITKLALFVNYRIIICTLDYLCGPTAPGLQVDTPYFIFPAKYHTRHCRTLHLTNIDGWGSFFLLSLDSWPFMQYPIRYLASVFFLHITYRLSCHQPGCGCLSVSGPRATSSRVCGLKTAPTWTVLGFAETFISSKLQFQGFSSVVWDLRT